jgi:hypothetical protein
VSKQPSHRPVHTIDSSASTGPALGECIGRLRLHAWGRSAIRHVVSRTHHKFPSPPDCLSLSLSVVVSLSSPKPADGSSPAAEKWIEGGGHASSLLVRRLGRYIDYLASSSATTDPCTGRISTIGILQCRLVLKSPSISLFYS